MESSEKSISDLSNDQS
jgi:hypothetical protein